MVKFCRSAVDEYSIKYERQKFLNECYEIIIDAQAEKIRKLKEENNAYKILLTKELNKKVGGKQGD